MKIIQLTQGKETIVDDEDYDFLCKEIKWSYDGRYARGWSKKLNKKLRMHRMIAERMGITGNVDHKDRNRLNNQRNNLRIANQSQNIANSNRNGKSISGYKGVYPARRKWMARIQVNYKFVNIGYFETAEEAARAYDKAARNFFGEFACTNFQD